MGLYLLATSALLAAPRAQVFPFFAEAENLELLTPPWLHFEILTPRPIAMATGTHIDYRLRLHGVPLRWRTEISVWEPPHRFVDRQLVGPYHLWVHEHRFYETPAGTLATDQVWYRPRGGALIHALFVRGDLTRIFTYRQEQLLQRFGGSGRELRLERAARAPWPAPTGYPLGGEGEAVR